MGEDSRSDDVSTPADVLDRRSLVAIGVLVALVVVYLVTVEFAPAERPAYDETPVFEGVEALERIELMHPVDQERPELVVLERRDDQWWMTRPVEARVDDRVAGRFEAVFGSAIATDDIAFGAERADQFSLGPDRAVRVAAFGAGDERPALELLVGGEIDVPETGVRRTFVRRPDEEMIYRAREGLGRLVRLTSGRIRDRRLMEVRPRDIAGFEWEGRNLRVVRDDGGWRIAGGDRRLPEGGFDRFAEFVAGLRVHQWVSGVSASRAGLDESTGLLVDLGDRVVRLEIGASAHDGGYYYGRFSEADDIFLLAESTVRTLLSPGALRGETE